MSQNNQPTKAAKPKRGRRSYYLPDYAAQAYDLALLGHTDEQLAEAFGVSETCLKNWRARHAEFGDAVRRGKDVADGRVAKALLDRALGYDHTRRRIYKPDDDGNLVLVEEIREHEPPDVAAGKWWLGNRRPDRWGRAGEASATATAHAAAASVSVVAGLSDDLLERVRDAGRAAGWQLAGEPDGTQTTNGEPDRQLEPA